MTRIWLTAALAVGIWLLSVHGLHRPAPLGLDAPATVFSAARADVVLGRLLGPGLAHPAGSPQAAAVRTRLLQELAALKVPARAQTRMSCNSGRRWGIVSCATITNIVADVVPGAGKHVLLVAHTDSVAAGPGAGDDLSGVATIIESMRALKARKAAGPITALFTDGEENGMLGAQAYLRDRRARDRIRAVINVEARGNRGPSYLFQTSAGDASLVSLYARSVSHYAASSLYGEIYKYLPNDTDLTPFLRAGLTGFNFAFIGNIAHYHTPLDRRENIEPASLQQHGDNLLGLADTLSRTDAAQLKSGDAIYLDVLGRWLPRLPRDMALPLSLAAFGLTLLAALLTRRERRETRRPIVALLMPPLLLAGCVGMGFALHGIAAWISGQPDPSYTHPLYLRTALAFGAFAVALLAARGAGAVAGWIWFSALSIAAAVWAPGLTPYFLFPVLVAAPLLLATIRGGRGMALLLSALAGLVAWLGLAASSEAIMGLRMHPLFTITAGFALVALLPLLASRVKGAAWGWSVTASLVMAIALAITAGLQPAFSQDAPERLNLRYAEQGGKAFWLADPVARLPQALRDAADFSATPQRKVEMAYVAPAGAAQFPAPTAMVTRAANTVTLDVRAPGEGVLLIVQEKARLQSVTIGGVTTPAPPGQVAVICGTPDCTTSRIALALASPAPQTLLLIGQRRGLPAGGARLLKARGATAVPSQGGDRTLLAVTIRIPGR